MAATIKDLARKLNLSVSTVSYALNNGPKPVSPDVRERVLRAAAEMDYRPNRLARSLVTRRTHAVGVVLPTTVPNVMLSQFVQLALNGIVNAAEELGQDVVILTAYDRTNPQDYIAMASDARVDGAIYLAPHYDAVLPSGIPMAVVDAAGTYPAPSFNAHPEASIGELVKHLLALGHSRIAHIRGPANTAAGDQRYRAFVAAMAAEGVPLCEDYIVDGDFLRMGGYEDAKHLMGLPTPPTAIVCGNDENALGVYEACSELGLSIPGDLSVSGFDDAPSCVFMRPQLTTIKQPIEAMCSAAFRAVVLQAQGREAKSAVFTTKLINRGSIDSPRR